MYSTWYETGAKKKIKTRNERTSLFKLHFVRGSKARNRTKATKKRGEKK